MAAAGAFRGAVEGAIISGGLTAVNHIAKHRTTRGLKKAVIKSAVDGAIDGACWGAAIGAVVGAAAEIQHVKKLSDVERVLYKSKETTRVKGNARNFEKGGGYKKTLKDFKRLGLSNVRDIETKYGPGKLGYMSNGAKVIARQGSNTGGATLEIVFSKRNIYKIRY